ncbi:hypothetical protein [Microbacterium paludicola]|uniref:hypothetical protein n=1 Tax=Microbacterium paludicola TaxID=300019 RepID=UPI0031DA456B
MSEVKTEGARVAYGDRVAFAGIVWELQDTRQPETHHQDHLGRLVPVDPETGERVEVIRIGRAERIGVQISLTAAGDHVHAYPSTRGYTPELTDAQRRTLAEAIEQVDFDVAPLQPIERAQRIGDRLQTQVRWLVGQALGYELRQSLRESLQHLPAPRREALLEELAARIADTFTEQLRRDLRLL